MSRIADLEHEIQAATEAVARAERAASRYPQYASAFVTVRSAEKLRSSLVEKFNKELSFNRVSACSYKIDYEAGRGPAIHGVTAAVGLFQDMFTTVFHAITNGPRKRAKVSQESLDATRLDFSFTFPGSVGFMMTIRNEEDLFGGSIVSEAMEKTLELVSASDTEKLDHLTETVGLPAVRLAHQWAAENARFGFGAVIKWRVEQDNPTSTQVQPSEVTRLAGMLSQYIAKERMTVLATLQHVNMFDKTFEMTVDDKRIVGKFEKAISSDKPASLPKVYTAHLTVATRVAPSEESDGITYFLDRLENYSPGTRLVTLQDDDT